MAGDLTYALRSLRKTPGFTAIVAISMALGIAANTTVFSMVNGALLGSLPVRDPQNLYTISGGNTFSYPDFRDFRDQCAEFFQGGLAAHFPLAPASLAGGRTPERVWGALVTGNYFSVVGPPLALGRGVAAAEDQVPGRDAVVVLSHSLWMRRFGGDPAALGQSVILNGRRYTVIGVMAPGFQGSDRGFISDFWAPLSMSNDFVGDIAKDLESRTTSWIVITGRLKEGVERRSAEAAVNVAWTRMRNAYHKDNHDSATLTQAGGIIGDGRGVSGFMTMLMAVVSLVLLVACANVANLLLARGMERRKEIGIRLAVGAGRGRIIRQLLVESVTLSLLGAAGGFALAFIAARALSGFRLPLPVPFALDFTPDLRVLVFTAVIAVAAGVAAGLAPALATTRTNLISAVKGETAGPQFFRRFGLRNLLIGFQVTLSAVLLIGAGLFLRSLGAAAALDLGIRPENTLVMAVDPKTAGYSDERFREFLRLVDTRIGSLPGVRSAAASNILPLSMAHNGDSFFEPSAGKDKGAGADTFSVTAPYFETIGLPLLRGRNFRPDSDVRQAVIIVNQTMARRIFGDRDPLGQMLKSGGGTTYEVIGVAKDSKSVTLGEEVKACGYTYLGRTPSQDVMSLLGMTILVKTTGDPAAMMNTVRREVERLDPNLAVFSMETMEQHVTNAFLVPRLCATLFGTFGLLGLILAGVGLYGVASYSVRARTREIGIRMALGAQPGSILRLVTGQGLGIVAAGLALGLGAAWSLSRFAASLLYGVSPTDAVTFLAVPAALLATALLALLVPARRASGLDPMKALRTD